MPNEKENDEQEKQYPKFNLSRHDAKPVGKYPVFEIDNLGNLSLWESKDVRSVWLPKETAIQFAKWLNDTYSERQQRPISRTR